MGDVMMARGVDSQCRERGWDYLFSGVRTAFRGADLVFGNLECPVSRRGARMSRLYTFRADPACVPAIRRAGFDLLSLANNHAMDYGRIALADTLDLVEENGMQAVGAGRTYARATDGVVVARRGIRIGFLGFSAFPSVAGVFSPNEPSIAVMSDQRLAASIGALKRRCDVVVVSCHWGLEGNPGHTAMQQRLARMAIDCGASLVLGHHPHVPEDVEQYHGGVIVYSLGNFVFDEKSRGGNSGLLFTCRIAKRGVTAYAVRGVRIARCRPTIAPDSKGRLKTTAGRR